MRPAEHTNSLDHTIVYTFIRLMGLCWEVHMDDTMLAAYSRLHTPLSQLYMHDTWPLQKHERNASIVNTQAGICICTSMARAALRVGLLFLNICPFRASSRAELAARPLTPWYLVFNCTREGEGIYQIGLCICMFSHFSLVHLIYMD